MGGEKDGVKSSDSRSCWSAETNWADVHGYLQNSISFESPIYPIAEEEEKSTAISKNPLILQSPPSDSIPCEIKVTFTQKHEVRQVYVCSTARVYEIYYATEQHSGNEYLCTVRCGVAEREGKVLNTGETGEAIFELKDGHDKTMKLSQEGNKNASTSSSDEDGWVELKVPDSPLNDTISPLSNKVDGNGDSKIQDYHEATAEITDASACTSITLRLLSLQVKGCVYIEEIYIFAEPVESTDSGHQAGPVHDSTKGNLLAMLVPSLSQLSKLRRDRIQDRPATDPRETWVSQHSSSKAAALTNPELGKQATPVKMADPRVIKMPEMNNVAEHEQLGSGKQTPGMENIIESVSGGKNFHLEQMLSQLDSRMGRIEAFCARFEENLLKPLSFMATRLEQLEQKLDALSMSSQSSRPLSCTRIVAPEFSFEESESNSFSNGDNENAACDASESMQNVVSVDRPSFDDKATVPVVVTSELCPCLAVTAPEFSSDEEDDDKNYVDIPESVRTDPTPEFSNNDVVDKNCDGTPESVMKDCQVEKRSLSIDDALASALSAFLSSASSESPKFTPTLIIKAPDFPNEDESNEELVSPFTMVSHEEVENPNTNVHKNDEADGSLSTAPVSISQDGEICVQRHIELLSDSQEEVLNSGKFSFQEEDNPSINPNEDIIVTQNQLCMGGVQDSRKDANMNGMEAHNCQKSGQIDFNSVAETANGVDADGADIVDQVCGEGTVSSKTDSSFDKTVINQNQQHTEQTNQINGAVKGISPGQIYEELNNDCTNGTMEGDITYNGSAKDIPVQNEGQDEDRLENELQHKSEPLLDFNLPILDVKFVSHENWSDRLPLETLLGGDSVEKETQTPVTADDLGDEPVALSVNDQFLELEELTVKDMASCFQNELQDPSISANQEPVSSLI